MGLEFHLTHYERYRREGIDAYRQGNRDRARFCLLKSAEHLYQVAAASEGRLQEERARRAGELMTLARDIREGRAPAKTHEQRERDSDGEGGGGGERFLVEERPRVTFEDIAGLADVKEEIRLKIIYPFEHPEKAEQFGIRPGGGVLLYGPPGTGKTLMARAVAGEVNCAFFTVKPSEIMSKWVGEAEQNFAALFSSAREQAPSVIFIDEIEALAPRRSENHSSVMQRLVPQILSELEGFSGRTEPVLFIGATNKPWSLDAAIKRPGRFDEKIYLGLPDAPAIQRILEIHLEDRPLAEDVDLRRLSEVLAGYTGADLRNICRKAADEAFLKSIRGQANSVIDMVTLLEICREVKPSVSPKDLKRFQEYREKGT